MNRKIFVAILFCLIGSASNAQDRPAVEREFRAAWIATVDNIDFPSKKALSIEDQKKELIRDLEIVKELKMNAVIFQVRPMCDALYRSRIEPWSEFLTGEMGKPQAFDPLKFLVAEAHKRGILVHAWFNPYRAYHPAAKTVSGNHISKRRPDLVKKYGKYLWLDPGEKKVQDYSLSVVLDVVRRYDVDGVHFDDYFYPYPERDADRKKIDFPDEVSWEKYVSGGGKLGREDWRRKNVDDFIGAVGRGIKKIRPDVMFGISPFGIWRPVPERISAALTHTWSFTRTPANGCRKARWTISRRSFTGKRKKKGKSTRCCSIGGTRRTPSDATSGPAWPRTRSARRRPILPARSSTRSG